MKVGEIWIKKQDKSKWILVSIGKKGFKFLNEDTVWLRGDNDDFGWVLRLDFINRFYKDYNESR